MLCLYTSCRILRQVSFCDPHVIFLHIFLLQTMSNWSVLDWNMLGDELLLFNERKMWLKEVHSLHLVYKIIMHLLFVSQSRQEKRSNKLWKVLKHVKSVSEGCNTTHKGLSAPNQCQEMKGWNPSTNKDYT